MGGTKSQNALQWKVLGVHWDILWCYLNHIFEAVRYQSASMGGRVGFFMFVVAFGSGQREDKHGIYCVGHTLPTLLKSHVSYSIWTPF